MTWEAWPLSTTSILAGGRQFFVRELNVSATLVQWLAMEVGSFAIEKGYSSEITSFDDDGYISGERLSLRDQKQFWFDQVTLTSAYFGDFDKPNLFARTDGFAKSNYRQLAAKKAVHLACQAFGGIQLDQ